MYVSISPLAHNTGKCVRCESKQAIQMYLILVQPSRIFVLLPSPNIASGTGQSVGVCWQFEMILPRTCSLPSSQCLPVASSTTLLHLDTFLCTVAAVGLNGHIHALFSSRHNVAIIISVPVQPLTRIWTRAFVSFQSRTYLDASICAVADIWNMDACLCAIAAV